MDPNLNGDSDSETEEEQEIVVVPDTVVPLSDGRKHG